MKLQQTILVSALLVSSAAFSAEETLKVALSTAITGPVVQHGDMHRAGVHLAAESINAKGGVLGKKIEIIEMDDACNPNKAVEIAHKIIAEKINYVLGPLCSGAVAAAAKIYDDNQTIMITSTASSDALSEQNYAYFFRSIGKDEKQAKAGADYLLRKVKPKNLAILHENQAYGQSLAAHVKKEVESKGLTPLIVEEIAKGGTDFGALISRLKEAKVDAVYYGGYHPELMVLLKQAEEQGFKARFMGPGGVASPAVKGSWAEGLLVTLPEDVLSLAKNKKVVEAFVAKKSDPSGPFVMTSYASMQVLAQAIHGAKVDDSVKVAEFMHKSSFNTVLGKVKFSKEGNNTQAVFDVFTWHQDASKTKAR